MVYVLEDSNFGVSFNLFFKMLKNNENMGSIVVFLVLLNCIFFLRNFRNYM